MKRKKRTTATSQKEEFFGKKEKPRRLIKGDGEVRDPLARAKDRRLKFGKSFKL